MKDSDRGRANGCKILLYDVETSPNLSFTWGKYEQNVIDFVKERQIISIAWKWLGEKDVHCLSLPMFTTYKRDKEDNKALMVAFHAVMSQADIVVGHNSIDFDDKMVRADFIRHGLPPIPPHKCFDTKLAAKRYFRFNSNKLDDLGARLGLGRKMKHEGFSLWLRCMSGDPKAWSTMTKYNIQDVLLLEKLYLKLRPWAENHPNTNIYSKDEACPSCRSKNLKPNGKRMMVGGWHQRFQCQDCGKWCAAIRVKGVWRFR